ncbi:hypothetical protein ACFVYV_46980 [Streptomyces mirabilis]|uniref:hypothetical protein n=1 Tax=Streptomyces mirabilis TaxID=68239 RepID=UPI0036DCDA1B
MFLPAERADRHGEGSATRLRERQNGDLLSRFTATRVQDSWNRRAFDRALAEDPPHGAEVEQVRGDSFRADWRITDLIRHAATCKAPDPGVVCADDGPEFTALQEQVRQALKKDSRKEPALGRRGGRALYDGCPACS